jgi:hypothetical protein
VADEKKPPAYDPDKTVVDVRPQRQPPRQEDSDKTVVAPRRQPPPQDDSDRTVIASRPASPKPPADESERTVVMTRTPAPDAGDRTVVTPTSAVGGAAADRTMLTPRPQTPVAATPSGDFLLVQLTGPRRGERFTLGQDEALIGSGSGAHVQLTGAESVHVKLRRQDDGYDIENVGTPGSVIVHGRKIGRARMKAGDLVKVGEDVLRLVRVGDMFSSEYSEAEFESAGVNRFLDPDYLREHPLVPIAAVLGVVLLVVLFFRPPSFGPRPTTTAQTSEEVRPERAKEVSALLLAGEVLFNENRFVAPSDRPDEENAYAKFNQALALDPGNEKARDWLRKIDAKLAEARKQREEAEKRRQDAENAARDAQRRELAKKVEAILVAGDGLLQAGKVVEPAGDNALVRYREALKVDPHSTEAQERIRRAVYTLVEQGDELRDKKDPWKALELYRKADRAVDHRDPEIAARIDETERNLKAGMASTLTRIVIYRDDNGQLFVLDEIDKVPGRYRDRAIDIQPAPRPQQ